MKKLPLSGKKIVVTRPVEQSEEFVQKIQNHGGTALVMPAICVKESPDKERLQKAIRELPSYDWVVFTSVNGVKAVWREVKAIGLDNDLFNEVALAAIGPATGKVLQELFRKPDRMPEKYISDDIPDLMGHVKGKKILLPRADIARKDMALDLESRGAVVDDVVAYSVVENDDQQLLSQLKDEAQPDFITFTSSSTVRGFKKLLDQAGRVDWFQKVPVASIGPITARTVRELGVEPAIVAETYTTDGLIGAIIDYH